MLPNQTPSTNPLAAESDTLLAVEMRFIAEWASGNLPFLPAIVRVRQVYRAHPLVFDNPI